MWSFLLFQSLKSQDRSAPPAGIDLPTPVWSGTVALHGWKSRRLSTWWSWTHLWIWQSPFALSLTPFSWPWSITPWPKNSITSSQSETWQVFYNTLPKSINDWWSAMIQCIISPSLFSGFHWHLHSRDVPQDHRPGSLLLFPGGLEHLWQHHCQSESNGTWLGQRWRPLCAQVL